MAFVNLFPDANYSVVNWTVVGGGTHHNAVAAYDAGTLYIQIRNDLYQNGAGFSLDTMPATDGNDVTTMSAYHYVGRNTSGPGDYRAWWQRSGNYFGAWTNFKVSWTEEQRNPTSPLAYNESEINANYFGIQSRGNASGVKYGRLEREYLQVQYTPAAGLQIIAWAIPLIGIMTSFAQWGILMNAARRRQLCHRHHMPIGTCRRSIFGPRSRLWPVEVHYDRMDYEALTKTYRDSLRSYWFQGETQWQLT